MDSIDVPLKEGVDSRKRLHSIKLTAASGLSLVAVSLSLIALVFLFRVLGHDEVSGELNQRVSSLDQKTELYECVTQLLDNTKPAVSVPLYEQISWFCGRQVQGLDQLKEFNVRLEGFNRQRVDDPIILWMVVAITLSGVGMAGLQLFASYVLASRGRGELATPNQFSMESDKLTLKSSVTGLVILTVSLAFFIVYVKWVYTITDVKFDMPPNASVEADIPQQIGVGPQFNKAIREQPRSILPKSGSISSPPAASTQSRRLTSGG